MSFDSGAMPDPTTTAPRASAQQQWRRCPDDEGRPAPARQESAQSEPDWDPDWDPRSDWDQRSRAQSDRSQHSQRTEHSHVSSDYTIRDVEDDDDDEQGSEHRPKRKTRRKTLPASLRRSASARQRIKELSATPTYKRSKSDSHVRKGDGSTDSALYEGWQDLSRPRSPKALPPCIFISKKFDKNRPGLSGYSETERTERTANLTPSNSDDDRSILMKNDSISSENGLRFGAGPPNSARDGSRDSASDATGSCRSNTSGQHNGDDNDAISILIEDFKIRTSPYSPWESGNRELSSQGSTLSDESRRDNARRRQSHRSASVPNVLASSSHSDTDLHGSKNSKNSSRSIMADYIALKLDVAELQSELQVAQSQLRKCTAAMSQSGESLKRLQDEHRTLQHDNDALRERNAELEENNLFFLSLFAQLERRGRLEGVVDAEFLEGSARSAAAADDRACAVYCAAADGDDGELEAHVRPTEGSNGGAKSYKKMPSMGTATTAMLTRDRQRGRTTTSTDSGTTTTPTTSGGWTGRPSEEKDRRSSLFRSNASTLVENIWNIPRAVSKSRQPSAREGDRNAGREGEHPGSGRHRRHQKQSQEQQRIPTLNQREELQDDRGVTCTLPRFVKFRDSDMKDLICSGLSVDAAGFRFAHWWNKRSSPEQQCIERGVAAENLKIIIDVEEEQQPLHPHQRDGILEPRRWYLLGMR